MQGVEFLLADKDKVPIQQNKKVKKNLMLFIFQLKKKGLILFIQISNYLYIYNDSFTYSLNQAILYSRCWQNHFAFFTIIL